jgi:hypothetical protein
LFQNRRTTTGCSRNKSVQDTTPSAIESTAQKTLLVYAGAASKPPTEEGLKYSNRKPA